MQPLSWFFAVFTLEVAVYGLVFWLWGATAVLFLGAVDFGLLALVQTHCFFSSRS